MAAGAIVLVLVLVVAAMAMASLGPNRATGMVAGGSLPANLAPGHDVDVAVRVDAVTAPGLLDGSVLVHLSGETYRRSAQQIHVRWGPRVSTPMGDLGEIGPGAIVQVHGVTGAGGAVHAQQLTVLTSFVQVVAS
jgi:hypothetical protein